MEDDICYDYHRLRQDLMNYFEGAYFGTGFGAALVEDRDALEASDDELIEIARRNGFPLERYVVDKPNKK